MVANKQTKFNMADKILFTFILCAGITSSFAGTYCYNHDDSFWCDEGCCGSYGDKYCCANESDGAYESDDIVEVIIGIVIGCIIFVVLVVSVVVAICCCCRKTRGRTGQVCQPATAQTTTIQMHSPLPYGQVGYNGAINMPVTIMTSNVTPGTTQQWQQPVAPPKYEDIAPKQ
ncbi:protein shisa-5-like [Ruditapes philippinarum]|uniref:protein shisa-5-like n=1 Tax=Ruditapes philippinarum TaxID=129788 RepID=UPI00295B66B0|nr:protein shisa-5-like [Ruditapes philippinarum]